MASAHQGKLETIEAARGIAALAVVFFHGNASAAFIGARTFEWLSIGEHGVDFFFVLSGFIIFFVHYQDIGRPGGSRDYLLKRALRLFPILWIVVGGWAVLRTAVGQPPSLETLGTSLLLYPSTAEPAPLVVWTLRHEALFYLAFLALILSRKAGMVLFGLWTAAALVQLALSLMGGPVGGLASFFLSSYALDFIFGAGIAILHRRRSFRRTSLPLILATLLIVTLFWIEKHYGIRRTSLLDYSTPAATLWVAILGLGFAAVLHGLLCIEGKFKVPLSAPAGGCQLCDLSHPHAGELGRAAACPLFCRTASVHGRSAIVHGRVRSAGGNPASSVDRASYIEAPPNDAASKTVDLFRHSAVGAT